MRWLGATTGGLLSVCVRSRLRGSRGHALLRGSDGGCGQEYHRCDWVGGCAGSGTCDALLVPSSRRATGTINAQPTLLVGGTLGVGFGTGRDARRRMGWGSGPLLGWGMTAETGNRRSHRRRTLGGGAGRPNGLLQIGAVGLESAEMGRQSSGADWVTQARTYASCDCQAKAQTKGTIQTRAKGTCVLCATTYA